MMRKLLAIEFVTQVVASQINAHIPVNIELHNQAISMGVSPEAIPQRQQAEVSQTFDPTQDIKVFHMRDADKSSYLEDDEMALLMKDAGVANVIDWRSFDQNGDGKLSVDEFVQAGPAVLEASKSLIQDASTHQQELSGQKDMEYFRQNDVDNNGFLDDSEMYKAIVGTGISPESFNWHAFDHDGDGRMNPAEFRAAGPALTKKQKLFWEQDLKYFRQNDNNHDGLLDDSEMHAAVAGTGLAPESFNWRDFDKDGDGRLNPAEFLATGPAVLQALKERKASGTKEASSSLAQQEPESLDRAVFAKADFDHNGFVDAKEINTLLMIPGLSAKMFNWQAYDYDQDGKLSFDEFSQASPAIVRTAMQTQEKISPIDRIFDHHYSDVNSTDAASLEEEVPSELADLAFNVADTNSNGFIDEDENLYGVDWRSFDQNGDGKLSHDEFTQFLKGGSKENDDDEDDDVSTLLQEDEEEAEGTEEDEDATEGTEEESSDEDGEDSDENEFGEEGSSDAGAEQESSDDTDEEASLGKKTQKRPKGLMRSARKEVKNAVDDNDDSVGDEDIENGDEEEDEDGEGETDIENGEGEEDNSFIELDNDEADGEGDEDEDAGCSDGQEEGEEEGGGCSCGQEEGGGEGGGCESLEDEEEEGGLSRDEKHEKWAHDMLKSHDNDEDSLLDEEEVKTLLAKTQAPSGIKWENYDANKDGKLNQTELLEMRRQNSGTHLYEEGEDQEGQEDEDLETGEEYAGSELEVGEEDEGSDEEEDQEGEEEGEEPEEGEESSGGEEGDEEDDEDDALIDDDEPQKESS